MRRTYAVILSEVSEAESKDPLNSPESDGHWTLSDVPAPFGCRDSPPPASGQSPNPTTVQIRPLATSRCQRRVPGGSLDDRVGCGFAFGYAGTSRSTSARDDRVFASLRPRLGSATGENEYRIFSRRRRLICLSGARGFLLLCSSLRWHVDQVAGPKSRRSIMSKSLHRW